MGEELIQLTAVPLYHNFMRLLVCILAIVLGILSGVACSVWRRRRLNSMATVKP